MKMKTQNENNNIGNESPGISCCAGTNTNKGRPLIYGIMAALAMIGFYIGLITLTSDWYNAKAQFSDYRWWLIALAAGLGLQVGLFTRTRQAMAAAHLKGAATGMAASGGISGVAMAICCSHYLAGLLPILGLPFLSTAVAGLERYQTQFFILGVVSNLLGMLYIVWIMKKNGLLPNMQIVSQLLKKDYNNK
jgi:hypothetical protein